MLSDTKIFHLKYFTYNQITGIISLNYDYNDFNQPGTVFFLQNYMFKVWVSNIFSVSSLFLAFGWMFSFTSIFILIAQHFCV